MMGAGHLKGNHEVRWVARDWLNFLLADVRGGLGPTSAFSC